MLSVQSIYNGKRIKQLERFNLPTNVEVVFAVIDQRTPNDPVDNKIEVSIASIGIFEDERLAEEIITEIYDSRTPIQTGLDL